MAWTINNYPDAMKTLSDDVRSKAVEIANSLVEDGYEQGHAIPIATKTAKQWAENRFGEEDENMSTVHVVPHPRGWAVRGSNAQRADYVLESRYDAYDKAVELARGNDRPVMLHEEE